MSHRPFQYSLGALMTLLTSICLVLGYIRFVGLWRVVLALAPPLFIAGFANYIMSPAIALIPRPSKRYEEWEARFPASVRVLVSLVLGLLIWIPVLLALTFM